MASNATYHLKDVEEEAFIQVNTLLLDDLNTRAKACPSRDMTELLVQKAKTYPALRKSFRDSSVQSATQSADCSDDKSAADERTEFQLPANATIIRPLSATASQAALKDSDDYGQCSDLSAIIGGLNRLVATSEVIWHLGSTAVLGLNPEIVMKTGNDIDIDHIHTLEYIKHHAPRVPIPHIHGILQQPNSNRTFLLMSRAPGEPLDSKWQFLDENEKASIREQLDSIVGEFRFLPAPASDETQAVLGGGSPRRCKDARRQIRVAQGCISNEREFNEFLTSNPHRARTGNISMIKSYLEDDHKVFLAHGDFHPRNIMVVTHLDGPVADDVLPKESLCSTNGIVNQSTTQVTVTAILDWEMCGWYPEYWEYVKALNTITPGSGMDDCSVLSTPVFLSHGADDECVSMELGRQASRILQTIMIRVEWHEFAGAERDGHWIKEPEGFDQILQFLET
ncbi:Phospholipase/carboxylesterase/thioesterase [Penicillium italicum]|uniref:Phospholipase/carboxylesterase/thioesterase n=1 Tax=Penicillium italicum TaxID=40296 RepID=A0A0A2KCV1_PENIT|nr:Phospholipase/carboxylesterase/thioesterase [Penicillium italicum]